MDVVSRLWVDTTYECQQASKRLKVMAVVRKKKVKQTAAKGATAPKLTVVKESKKDYSDDLFEADIEKAAPAISKLKDQALKDHKTGKTRKFPA